MRSRGGSCLRISDKLLIAAYGLATAGQNPFTAEDLVMSAWKLFPDAFGLAGYADGAGKPLHPDSNRVFAEIMGSKPLRRMGLLRKTGSKTYELTQSGEEVARGLAFRQGVEGPGKSVLSRAVRQQARRLLESRVLTKFIEHGEEALTFHDACTFWGISPHISAVGFMGRVSNLRRTVELVSQEASDSAIFLEHGRGQVNPEDLVTLLELDEALRRRFKPEIDIILRRTDERAQ